MGKGLSLQIILTEVPSLCVIGFEEPDSLTWPSLSQSLGGVHDALIGQARDTYSFLGLKAESVSLEPQGWGVKKSSEYHRTVTRERGIRPDRESTPSKGNLRPRGESSHW